MNPEGLITKKTSGKDVLTVKDISARSGMDETYIRKCIKHGFLKPSHFSSKYAVDGVELSAGDKEMVDKHVESIRAKRGSGFTSEKAMREVATSQVVESKKLQGIPTNIKWREQSAEETFDNFWKGPSGIKRMVKPGKLKKEVENIDRGGAWYDNPQGLSTMPDNFDAVLWETTKQKAAELHVMAQLGDKEAAEKYNKIRSNLADPSLLPSLDAPKKIQEKEIVK